MNTRYETDYGIFEWDSEKSAINLRKHGLDFYAATEVFRDERAVIRHDVSHSAEEERFKIVGCVRGFRIAAIIFTDRKNITRIISARKATSAEEHDYERHFKN